MLRSLFSISKFFGLFRSIYVSSRMECDEVCSGDVLCEIQTDKTVVALECEEDGVLAKILVPAGSSNIKVGEFIAVLANSDEDWEKVAKSASSLNSNDSVSPSSTSSSNNSQSSVQLKNPVSYKENKPSNLVIGPAVRLLLQSFELNGAQIPATGPHDQLLKGDVLAYIAKNNVKFGSNQIKFNETPVKKSSLSHFTDIPLSNMRQVIAKRLSESKSSIPHAYVQGVACLDEIMELRKELKQKFDLKLSVNDFVIKACALGLKLVPELNAIADPQGHTCKIMHGVNICMAVATPAGLITPILPSVNELSLSEISKLSNNLVEKARNNKLKPHEFQGGTFTISNLGMFGIREFSAIINLPQVAILAVGAGLLKPKIIHDNVQFSTEMTLTLSIDSRFVNEVKAGEFLKHVANLLTNSSKFLCTDELEASIHASELEIDEFDSMMISTRTNT